MQRGDFFVANLDWIINNLLILLKVLGDTIRKL